MTKAYVKEFFSHPVELTGSMYFENIFRIMFLKDMYKKLKKIGIVQVVSELTIFVNL